MNKIIEDCEISHWRDGRITVDNKTIGYVHEELQTEDEFNKFAEGESFVCVFEGDLYVKFRDEYDEISLYNATKKQRL